MVKQRHQLFVSLLCVMDGLVVTGASLIAWAVRLQQFERYWPPQWESYIKGPFALFAVPIAIFCLWVFGLYSPRRDRSIWNEQGQILKASVVASAALVVVLWAVGNDSVIGQKAALGGHQAVDAGRLQIGVLAIVLPVLLGLHRAVFRIVLRSIRRRGWNLRHVAVIGAGRLGQITCRTLERNAWTGINVAYFLSHHETTGRSHCLGRPVEGGLDDLEEVLERKRVDAVYLAIPTARASVLPKLLRRLERFALDVRVIPDVPPRYLSMSMTVSELDGMPILSYRECPLYGLGGFSKRMLDMAGAAVALVLLSPVMAAVALAVRMSGPGPVMFKQRRVSLGGEEFNLYKFRSMVEVADEPQAVPAGESRDVPAAWTRPNDARITRVGRFLRRTSLDELPQLINVLKGEMSLVGPRPERPELIARFRDDWRGYMLRQHVKAGMTGWAQVNGLRGSTSLRKRLQYDLFYIRHWSLGFDLRILWLTIFRGFVHANAH